MTHTNAEWLEQQLRRWMRPDAHCFVRPGWRRYVRPGFEHDHPFALYEQKYRSDQPRVPAGNPDGGEWTADASGRGLLAASNAVVSNGTANAGRGINKNNDKPHIRTHKAPLPHISAEAAAAFAAVGHHYIPKGVFGKEKYSALSDEARAVFEKSTTGPLQDPTSNYNDQLHREYNKAVEEALDKFLKTKGIRLEKMTGDEARMFVNEVWNSEDPRILGFKRRMLWREFRLFMRGRARGRGFE